MIKYTIFTLLFLLSFCVIAQSQKEIDDRLSIIYMDGEGTFFTENKKDDLKLQYLSVNLTDSIVMINVANLPISRTMLLTNIEYDGNAFYIKCIGAWITEGGNKKASGTLRISEESGGTYKMMYVLDHGTFNEVFNIHSSIKVPN